MSTPGEADIEPAIQPPFQLWLYDNTADISSAEHFAQTEARDTCCSG